MADIVTTDQKIIDYLKQMHGETATVSDICTYTGVHKRAALKHLRQLKRYKLVLENRKTTPPKWSLSQHQANHSNTPSSAQDLQGLGERILKYLSQQKEPKTAICIAKNLGLRTKKSVNPVLYRLREDQLLVSNDTEGTKPLWCLSEKATAMAEELFRDSSKDTSAPGAYSPEKSSRDAGLHTERQQHRHVQRSQSNPYSAAAHAHRKRNSSGSGQSVVPTPDPSTQAFVSRSNSGVSVDGDDHNSSTFIGEDLTVILPSDGQGRQVTMTVDDGAQSVDIPDELKHNACTPGDSTHDSTQNIFTKQEATHSGLTEIDQTSTVPANVSQNTCEDAGDESADEDFEESSGYDYEPPNLTARYQEMMGDLNFEDLTYVDEGEMLEEDAVSSLHELVLLQLYVEPNHTATALQLAQALDKSEGEAVYVLGSCGDKVHVANHFWSLTDAGVAWAKEKCEKYPSLVSSVRPCDAPHFQGDSSLTQVPFASSSSLPKGPPPFPRQLVESYPSLYLSTGSGVMSDSSVLLGREGGRAGYAGAVSGREGGVQPFQGSQVLESKPSFEPPPPQSLLTSPMLQNATAPSDLLQRNHPPEGRHLSQETSDQPVMFFKSDSTASAGFQRTGEPQGVGLSHGSGVQRTQFGAMPTSFSLPSINPKLQKFAEEGLTFVPAPGSRMVVQPGTSGVGSMSVSQPGDTSMDVLERQMVNTGIAAQSVGGTTNNSLLQPCGDSTSSDMHRSHSQPQLSIESGSVSGMDGASSLLKITSESFAALNKNPISALMEYAQSRRLQAVIEVVSQRGPSHRPVFLMAAKMGNRQFAGVTCHNKKDGRKEAADVALRTLIAEGQYSAAVPTPSINIPSEEMTHFDKIAALTHQTFNTLIATIPENLAGRKVIAGLVMKRSEDDIGVVISIGTGNRCITGDKLSLEGNTVNDSHAEIVTRRGFMRFLYQQLEKYEPGQPHDLFEAGSSGRLRVKPGITFHLYISTAPCGDGALFSPRDVESNNTALAETERKEHHPTFTSNVQGLLRTKMEGGEGTIPVDTSDITMQTWDGVVRGERLRTMSCTDKICRWNVLGLQGALLSHFVEPIYLDSLTLGFLYDHGHLSRAVCCRLAKEEPNLDSALPQDFHLNHPWLGRVTACQPLRETQKTKAFSINWTIGDQKAEVLDGTLGHCYAAVEKRLFSRLAKRCLYDSFKAVAQHLGRHDLLQARSYHHSKQAALPFQEAKVAMISKFQQMGCGWVKKPVEEEMFS